jgi:hypothetical protein
VSGSLLAGLLTDLPLPNGGFNFVLGPSAVVGSTLAGDDRVDTIAMTGSSDAGRPYGRPPIVDGRIHRHTRRVSPSCAFDSPAETTCDVTPDARPSPPFGTPTGFVKKAIRRPIETFSMAISTKIGLL